MSNGTTRRWPGYAGWLLVAGLLIGGAALALRGSTASPPTRPARAARPAVTVTVETVTARPIRRTVSAVGSLYGRDEVLIAPKVEGRVLAIRHDIGDLVRPGEVLAELDPIDYQLAVAEARRALELELARLGLHQLPPAGFDVTTLPAVVRTAAMEKNLASRKERLLRSGATAITPEERDLAQTEYEVARANHQQALLDATTTLAAVRQRQAALESAQQKLEYTRILAPYPTGTAPIVLLVGSGVAWRLSTVVEYVVAQRSVSEGEMVWSMPAFPGANTTLYKLIIDRPLKLQATVPERYLGQIKVGQDAELEVEAYPHQAIPARVTRVNPSVDRTSRTFQVEIQVPNEDRKLTAGSFAKVAIATRVDAAAPTVPEEALVSFAGVTKVFVVEDDKVREVPVKAGVSLVIPGPTHEPARTWIEVEGDLPVGSSVVTSGQTQLVDGTAVRVRKQGTQN